MGLILELTYKKHIHNYISNQRIQNYIHTQSSLLDQVGQTQGYITSNNEGNRTYYMLPLYGHLLHPQQTQLQHTQSTTLCIATGCTHDTKFQHAQHTTPRQNKQTAFNIIK